MERALHKLFDRSFDVVVVGGGVYGATIALEAARRGYTVALVEKGDFNSGTSANSLKILHGGLRYLQHLNLGRMRRSIRSRNFFLRRFPHLIDNVPFLLPLRGYGIKGPLVMRAGLLLNDLIGLDRNRGVTKLSQVAGGCVLSPRRTIERFPGIDLPDCTGGALWMESVVNDTERLVLELVKNAVSRGAAAANYMMATALEQSGGKVEGVTCRDLTGGGEGVVRAGAVIDATGPGIGALGQALPRYRPAKRRHARAVNMILKRPLFGDTAVGLPCRDSVRDSASLASGGERMLFFVPWKGRTMVGTFYDLEENTEQGLRLSAGEKARFLDTVRALLPGHELSADDICRWHAGWLPLAENAPQGEIDLAKSSTVRSQRVDGRPTGLIEVAAAKFTTAPAVAKRVLEELASICAPTGAPKNIPPLETAAAPGNEPLARRLRRRYGNRWREVHAIVEQEPATAHRVTDEVTKAEILYAVRSEMACRLDDVVIRRTDMADCGLPPSPQLRAVADLIAAECGWSKNNIDDQLAGLQRKYEPG